MWNDQKQIRFLSNALMPLSELGLTTIVSSSHWKENPVWESNFHIPVFFTSP